MTQVDQRGWLRGRRVLVTAGGTREPIDPVRYIGNRSSGKMGNAIAHEACRLGAQVTLVTAAPPPPDTREIDVVPVETAAEMFAAVQQHLDGVAALFMAAAVADYRPVSVAMHKIKKRAQGGLQLELIPTVDILRALREDKRRGGVLVVGFAAETDDVFVNAQSKLRDKALDLIVANNVSGDGIGMGSDDNAVTILDRDGLVADVPRAPKTEIAVAVVAAARRLLDESWESRS